MNNEFICTNERAIISKYDSFADHSLRDSIYNFKNTFMSNSGLYAFRQKEPLSRKPKIEFFNSINQYSQNLHNLGQCIHTLKHFESGDLKFALSAINAIMKNEDKHTKTNIKYIKNTIDNILIDEVSCSIHFIMFFHQSIFLLNSSKLKERIENKTDSKTVIFSKQLIDSIADSQNEFISCTKNVINNIKNSSDNVDAFNIDQYINMVKDLITEIKKCIKRIDNSFFELINHDITVLIQTIKKETVHDDEENEALNSSVSDNTNYILKIKLPNEELFLFQDFSATVIKDGKRKNLNNDLVVLPILEKFVDVFLKTKFNENNYKKLISLKKSEHEKLSYMRHRDYFSFLFLFVKNDNHFTNKTVCKIFNKKISYFSEMKNEMERFALAVNKK